jgi:hypothetical protein
VARRHSARVLKADGLDAFVLDDAIGASAPTTDPTPRTEDPDASARELDERVARWIVERARFERRRGRDPSTPPAATVSSPDAAEPGP